MNNQIAPRIIGIVMMISALLLVPICAMAQDWYVDTVNGDDNNSAWRVHDGYDVAYRTIGQAVRMASSGDVIRVSAGTYNEHVSVNKQISIIGEDGAIIDGGHKENGGISVQNANGTVITGLIFTECSYAMYITSSAVSISNCVFKDNATAVFVYDPDNNSVAITGSAFMRNGHAVHSYYHTGNVTVGNCDFVDNGTAMYRQWSDNGGSVQQSIFAENSRTFWYRDPAAGSTYNPPAISYCNFYANSDAYTPPSTTTRARTLATAQNLAVDPQFVDKESDNLYLRAGSPMQLVDARQQTVVIGAYGVLASAEPDQEVEQALVAEAIEQPRTVTTISTTALTQEPVVSRPTTITLASVQTSTATNPVATEGTVTEAISEVQVSNTVSQVETSAEEPAATEATAVSVQTGVASSENSGQSLDSEAPVSTIAVDMINTMTNTIVPETELTLNATDAGSGVDYIEYRSNGGVWQRYSAPVEIHQLQDGANQIAIAYRAVDRQGNVETERMATYRVAPALQVSARMLTTPRVLCWWNTADERGGSRRHLRDDNAKMKALTDLFDSATLDYRIVEDAAEFLSSLDGYNVYMIVGDQEKLDGEDADRVTAAVSAGKSIISLGYADLNTPPTNDREWENIFGIKVAGRLPHATTLAIAEGELGDTATVAITNGCRQIRTVQGGVVLGSVVAPAQQRNGRHNEREEEYYPAIVAGNWEQGKTLYCCIDNGNDVAVLADVLKNAIVWAEPVVANTGNGDAVAVEISVQNAVLPMQLSVNIEGHPSDGCEVVKVFDGGEIRGGYAVWYDDLQSNTGGVYRLQIRNKRVASRWLSIDANYLDGRKYVRTETTRLLIQ